MHEQIAQMRRKAIAENTLFPARLNAMVAANGPTAEAHAFAAEQYRVGEPPTQAARRLLDFNQQYVTLVAADLPAPAAKCLIERFKLAAYPALYPDPANIDGVVDAVLALELHEDQRERIDSLRVECETTNEAAMQTMQRDYLAWKQRTCARSGFIFDEYYTYADGMQRVQQARIEKCKSAILVIETMLSAEQLDAVRPAYDLWQGWVDSFEKRRQAAITRHGRWPAPYD